MMKRSSPRSFMLVLLVLAAGCGKTGSHVDAAAGDRDGRSDLPCPRQGCTDLPVEVADDHPVGAPDAGPDRADGVRDSACTGQGCADLPAEVADVVPGGPPDVAQDRADALADAALDRADALADAAFDRSDGDSASPADAALDRADGPGDTAPPDGSNCPTGAKLVCIEGYYWGGTDGGFCPKDAGAIEPTCVNGEWRCPWGAMPPSDCTAEKCPDVLPSGSCSSGDRLDCWVKGVPFYGVACSCNNGTWSCLL